MPPRKRTAPHTSPAAARRRRARSRRRRPRRGRAAGPAAAETADVGWRGQRGGSRVTAAPEAGRAQAGLGPHRAGTGTAATQEVGLSIEGMTCAACAVRVEKKLNRLDEVRATVNYATASARVTAPAAMPVAELVAAVERAGYSARSTAATPDESPGAPLGPEVPVQRGAPDERAYRTTRPTGTLPTCAAG